LQSTETIPFHFSVSFQNPKWCCPCCQLAWRPVRPSTTEQTPSAPVAVIFFQLFIQFSFCIDAASFWCFLHASLNWSKMVLEYTVRIYFFFF
jgi:hypothetical protein